MVNLVFFFFFWRVVALQCYKFLLCTEVSQPQVHI